jgi:hypothetical protein
MSDRRHFLGDLAAASVGLWLGAPVWAAATETGGAPVATSSNAIHWLVDRRHSASVAFADTTARQGQTVHTLPATIGPRWSDALFQQLNAEAASLSGMSTMADYFVLSQLASDAGLRVSKLHVPSGCLASTPLVTWSITRFDRIAS